MDEAIDRLREINTRVYTEAVHAIARCARYPQIVHGLRFDVDDLHMWLRSPYEDAFGHYHRGIMLYARTAENLDTAYVQLCICDPGRDPVQFQTAFDIWTRGGKNGLMMRYDIDSRFAEYADHEFAAIVDTWKDMSA